jgi:YbgC/YbaW family acyl-CoA thioester hydrolase
MADALPTLADFKMHHHLRVRWAEVDLQKVVFNPHYLMYVDTAIADYWRALALPYEQTLAALGGELFVKKASLEFHASAFYDDRLSVGLRCARIGNSSLQFLSGIFRGDELLVSAELIYVFADPVSRRSLTVPDALRNTMLGYEQGASGVTTQVGDWTAMRGGVLALRTSDDQDSTARHCVLRNALGEPVATARFVQGAPLADGVAVMPSLQGAGWARAAIAALSPASN